MDSYLPFHDYRPFMKGIAGGGLGIVHVFLAQLAVGGGMLLCYFETLRRSGRSKYAGRFITGYFQDVVLVSFLLGALTGLAIWFVFIRFSPRTTGALVDEFHWIWATEWTFFCVEVVSGYAYVRYQDRTSGRRRMVLLGIYSVASWFSLFWMNGIVSSQLTPGPGMPARLLWSGFFNPSFWPSLLYRTVAAMAIAGLGECAVINLSGPGEREARGDLMGHALRFVAPMLLVPVLGAWFWASLPVDGRQVLPGSAILKIFASFVAVASLVIGAWGLCAFWYGSLEISRFATSLFCALALAVTAGGEWTCNLIREPSSIRPARFSSVPGPDALAERPR